jgi:hypothetical protein
MSLAPGGLALTEALRGVCVAATTCDAAKCGKAAAVSDLTATAGESTLCDGGLCIRTPPCAAGVITTSTMRHAVNDTLVNVVWRHGEHCERDLGV